MQTVTSKQVQSLYGFTLDDIELLIFHGILLPVYSRSSRRWKFNQSDFTFEKVSAYLTYLNSLEDVEKNRLLAKEIAHEWKVETSESVVCSKKQQTPAL